MKTYQFLLIVGLQTMIIAILSGSITVYALSYGTLFFGIVDLIYRFIQDLKIKKGD